MNLKKLVTPMYHVKEYFITFFKDFFLMWT